MLAVRIGSRSPSARSKSELWNITKVVYQGFFNYPRPPISLCQQAWRYKPPSRLFACPHKKHPTYFVGPKSSHFWPNPISKRRPAPGSGSQRCPSLARVRTMHTEMDSRPSRRENYGKTKVALRPPEVFSRTLLDPVDCFTCRQRSRRFRRLSCVGILTRYHKNWQTDIL